MCLLGPEDGAASLLHCLSSGMLCSSQLRELSGPAGMTVCGFLEECR